MPEVAAGDTLLVVGHAAPPPGSQHQPDPALMPSAAEVHTQLALPEQEWQTVRVEQAVRTGSGRHGHQGELVDSVVLLRRR